jgi:hypothetical protein
MNRHFKIILKCQVSFASSLKIYLTFKAKVKLVLHCGFSYIQPKSKKLLFIIFHLIV